MQHNNNTFDQLSTTKAVSQRPLRDRLGMLIEGSDTADVVARIRETELAGLRQIWMKVDAAGVGMPDVLTLLAAAALRTEQVRLGTAIVPIYPRHPLIMAQQALAIHDLAPGRLRLGIGPSNRMVIEDWLGLQFSSPLAYLTEYIQVMRKIMEGDANHQGRFFQMAFSQTRQFSVPLLVSALGKKAFQLAGEIADGAISWMSPASYLLASALPALQAGAEQRRRPTPPLIAHVLVALHPNQEAVLSPVRQLVAGYSRLPFYARMFAEAGFAGAVDGREADLNALASALVISGDEATVYQHITELLDSGLDELMLQLIPIVDETNERKQLHHLLGSLPA
ncbi:LLM class flavin-dependent oxidoreductase [Ktedonosporobacter rubrisoli]|uniref:LLM class flavin-dependent oxidoreductase n=1 Tax=Ktedonosporobacter rubrisoli TaxID=2509675 RepID=A0A4P6JJ98_KTERU|nr:LLM class flavin-dependent oxidoreductase [Ktedonosporobacter rubrisoli]QBD74992.1 LLM class flavin-dependent oxidoreductase [Ktedonosporobacter rubrisoli]